MTFPPRRSSSLSSFAATHPTAKILIVDDEPANVVLIRCILEDAGYRNLRTVTDSSQVEAFCREYDPDLVLLDLHMPGLSGHEVLAQLAPLTPPDGFRPVLVLSADIVPQNRQRALAAGASDFLTKPFARVEVLLRISNLLKMRFLQEQVRRQSEVFEGMVVERTTQLERALTDLHATQQQIIQQERRRGA